jgi:hypothetical protein
MLRLRLMKQPGFGPAWISFQLTASIPVAGPGVRVRMWAMQDALALIAAVNQVPGVATVKVRSELGHSSSSRLRDDLFWVTANCSRQLVLALGAVAGNGSRVGPEMSHITRHKNIQT